jgi:hypothetical protein
MRTRSSSSAGEGPRYGTGDVGITFGDPMVGAGILMPRLRWLELFSSVPVKIRRKNLPITVSPLFPESAVRSTNRASSPGFRSGVSFPSNSGGGQGKSSRPWGFMATLYHEGTIDNRLQRRRNQHEARPRGFGWFGCAPYFTKHLQCCKRGTLAQANCSRSQNGQSL